nr:hypothetical protein [Enterobacter hormaechei]
MPNGTLFYDWLAANDATFHRDLLIVRNGVKLGDDDELAFELSELDHIQIFDQPKGIVDDILSPIFKVVGQVFSYGQIRSFPDLIQESVFEYVHQTSTDGGLKYVTEWMCIFRRPDSDENRETSRVRLFHGAGAAARGDLHHQCDVQHGLRQRDYRCYILRHADFRR